MEEDTDWDLSHMKPGQLIMWENQEVLGIILSFKPNVSFSIIRARDGGITTMLINELTNDYLKEHGFFTMSYSLHLCERTN